MLQQPQVNLLLEQIQQQLRAETEARQRFYAHLSPADKGEFINGEVIMHSPAKKQHTDAVGNIFIILTNWVRSHGNGHVASEKALVTLTRNDYEPDVCYWSADKARHFAPDQLQYPAPDLVVEVLSDSTAARDRGVKLADYAAHGVREYWLADPAAQSLEQYVGTEGRFDLRFKADHGTIACVAIEGLQFPVRAAFDAAENLHVLRSILSS